VGTRDLDRLGGLIPRLPWTSLFFLIGSLSIAAVYPFSGFASEWLTLQTLLRISELPSTAIRIVFALCGVGLALTAALAVTCFVKAFAMGFLGMPRSHEAEQASEAPASMLAPMGALAILSIVLGIIPTFVIPTVSNTLTSVGDGSATQALVPPFFAYHAEHATLPPDFANEFHDLGAQVGQDVIPGRGLVVLHRGEARNPVIFAMSTSYGVVVLLVLLGVTWWLVHRLARARRIRREVPWDGGVRHLLPEMTYSATGFSNPVRVIFDAILRPRSTSETEETSPTHFRASIKRSRQQTHLVDRLFLDIVGRGLLRVAGGLARMHHGRVNAYVAYVLLTLLVFLVLAALSNHGGS
jgi:hydrogenase-4 component B